MTKKTMLFVSLIVLLLIGACAKRSTAPEHSKVLELVKEVPMIGPPKEFSADDRYVYVATEQCGLNVIDTQTWQSRWWDELHPGGSDSQLRLIRRASMVPEHNLLFLGEFDAADKIRIVNTSNQDSLKLHDSITGDTDNLKQIMFRAINDPAGNDIIEGYFGVSRSLTYSRYDGNFYIGRTWIIEYIPGTVSGFDITDQHAVIAVSQRGLVIYDLETRQLVGQIYVPGEALAVKVKGNYAYVACRQNGFRVVDISNPAAPVLKGGYDKTTGHATSVDVKDNLAIVSSGGGGVYLFDITNPDTPVLKENLTSAGYTNYAAFWKDMAVVASRDQGMRFYRIR
ncbi:MAG: hypothetical protein GX294_01270 [Candidatus Cloacimonetes bacterium]|nr:hypothetical protein [Candidatus Cloacimonadota bacterium]